MAVLITAVVGALVILGGWLVLRRSWRSDEGHRGARRRKRVSPKPKAEG